LAFASQRLRNEWFRAQKAPSSSNSKLNPDSTELLKKQTPEILAEALKVLGEAFSAMQTDMRVRSELLQAMQKSLVRKLEVGRLEACGVQSAPKQRRNLEVLQKHFFADAKINWAENKVTNFGVTYGSVRVGRSSSVTPRVSTEKALDTRGISSSALPEPAIQKTGEAHATPTDAQIRAITPPADHESAEAQRRKPGPLSGKAAVIAAYNQLLQNGVLREGITLKEIYKKLHSELRKNSEIFPNGRGLSYPSIVRHLSPLLRSSSQV
jgi:hypothetical protein